MVNELLNEMEKELGFPLDPATMYGPLSINTPEHLFTYVDTFYTATLLYYRAYPIVHFDIGTAMLEVNKKTSASMERGFKRLVHLEEQFPTIVKDLEPPLNMDFMLEWNGRTTVALKKLAKLACRIGYKRIRKSSSRRKVKSRIHYSVKLSEFFRDELVARLEFYKRLRKELAQALHKTIRDFSQLHALFMQYYGAMRFVDLLRVRGSIREDSDAARMLFDMPEFSVRLEELVDQCRSIERSLNKVESLQEYFFAVREYYKEVIQCALRMADSVKYSEDQKKRLLCHIAFWYVDEIGNQENIWHNPWFGGTGGPNGTWKYNWFFEETSPNDSADIDELKTFLEKTYVFITEHPRFGHPYPSDPVSRTIMESILERKPIDPDDLYEKMEREKKKS